MIKQLQRKFIIITMGSLLLVMVLVLGSINAINVYHMNQRADGLLALLAENGGAFPQAQKTLDESNVRNSPELLGTKNTSDIKGENQPKKEPVDDRAGNQLDSQAGSQINGQVDDRGGGAGGGRERRPGPGRAFQFSVETPFETRYFTVKTDSLGQITYVDTGHIAAISAAEARQYAYDVLKSGRYSGYSGAYRYLVSAGEEGQLISFVDCRMQIDTTLNFFWNSCGIALASLLIVLILVVVLSRRAIRPVIESLEKQKQFITDAGHEIKTPLAIISANNDVIEMTGGKSQWTSSIHNQVNRLNGLVKNLLTLAKIEEGQVNLVFSSLVFSDTVKEMAGTFALLAGKKEVKFELEVQPGIILKGDETSLAHLITILTDNAVKYAKEGGQVRISLEKRGRSVLLEVFNTCDNLPEGDLSRLFDRFYRGDESRSRESGGYGIGLSVAQAIVHAHGGKLSVRRQGQGAVCFTAELPAVNYPR